MTDSDYRVSAEQHAAFAEDGAIRLESVIGDEFVARLQDAVERVHDHPGGFWFKIYLWRVDPDFRECCLRSRLPGIAAQLLQTDKVNLLYDQLFVKPPQGEPTPWHNDLPYWPVDGTSVMSLWLALSEVTPDNGGLEFIRGSHRWQRRFDPFDADAQGQTYRETAERNPDNEPMPDFDAERNQHEILSWQLRPGDAIAFHALTVHTAGSNITSDRPRKGYALRFTGSEIRYHLGTSMNEHVLNPELEPGDVMDSDQYPVVFRAAS